MNPDLAATVLTVKTDAYAEDKQDLMWDIATILNAELRELQAAGAKIIQIEEPAIHSAAAYGAGRGVIGSSLIHQLKHILAGHLLTAELWESGIDAVSAGPEAWMGRDLRTVRAESTEVLRRWHGEHDALAPPEATHRAPLPLPRALAHAAARMLLPDRAPRVVLEVPATRVHWRTTLGGDVLRITDAAGAVESAMTVRGSAMRHALGRTLRSHAQLARSWDALRERYRAALPQHTTAASWTALFEAASDDTTERI